MCSSHCEKQKHGQKNTAAGSSQSRFLSHPGDGAKVHSGGALSALVFRSLYHGSEPGVFVCQQGSGTVKLQDLPGENRMEQNRTSIGISVEHPILITQAGVHEADMRTSSVIGEYCNTVGCFQQAACEINLNAWDMSHHIASSGFLHLHDTTSCN